MSWKGKECKVDITAWGEWNWQRKVEITSQSQLHNKMVLISSSIKVHCLLLAQRGIFSSVWTGLWVRGPEEEGGDEVNVILRLRCVFRDVPWGQQGGAVTQPGDSWGELLLRHCADWGSARNSELQAEEQCRQTFILCALHNIYNPKSYKPTLKKLLKKKYVA